MLTLISRKGLDRSGEMTVTCSIRTSCASTGVTTKPNTADAATNAVGLTFRMRMAFYPWDGCLRVYHAVDKDTP